LASRAKLILVSYFLFKEEPSQFEDFLDRSLEGLLHTLPCQGAALTEDGFEMSDFRLGFMSGDRAGAD
jgi:hypothetical protein